MHSLAAGRARRLAVLAAGVATLMIGCTQVASAEPIGVALIDGSYISGEVDDQTDTTRLWLRREELGVELTSGFAWSQVQAVYRGQRELTGTELRETINAWKTPGRSVLEIEPAMIPAAPDPSTENDSRFKDLSQNRLLRGGQAHVAPRTPQNEPVPDDFESVRPRVESLRIEAQLAHWGPNTATDGLRIFVFPLAADGTLVPVRGQLDLTLYAELRDARGGEYTVLRPEFRELESTSELVRIQDFAGGPAVYQLPFRRFHPDADFEVASSAAVHARLGISGRGVFEASADCVPLRNFSPFRDQLQLYTGQRFFPGEHVYRRPQLPRW